MKQLVIIDGYNVIQTVPSLAEQSRRNKAIGREVLMKLCRTLSLRDQKISRIIIVFDGDSTVGPFDSSSQVPVKIIFTKTDEEADRRIVDIIRESAGDAAITLVTNDTRVRREAREYGVELMTPEAFFKACSRPPRKRAKKRKSVDEEAGLREREKREITEELLKIWDDAVEDPGHCK